MHTTPEEIEGPKGAIIAYYVQGTAHLAWIGLLFEGEAYAAIAGLLSPVSLLSNGWLGFLAGPGIVPTCLALLTGIWLVATANFEFRTLLASCVLSMFWFWYRVAAVLCLAAVCLIGHYIPWPGVWFGLVFVANAAAVFSIIAGTRSVIKNAEGL